MEKYFNQKDFDNALSENKRYVERINNLESIAKKIDPKLKISLELYASAWDGTLKAKYEREHLEYLRESGNDSIGAMKLNDDRLLSLIPIEDRLGVAAVAAISTLMSKAAEVKKVESHNMAIRANCFEDSPKGILINEELLKEEFTLQFKTPNQQRAFEIIKKFATEMAPELESLGLKLSNTGRLSVGGCQPFNENFGSSNKDGSILSQMGEAQIARYIISEVK